MKGKNKICLKISCTCVIFNETYSKSIFLKMMPWTKKFYLTLFTYFCALFLLLFLQCRINRKRSENLLNWIKTRVRLFSSNDSPDTLGRNLKIKCSRVHLNLLKHLSVCSHLTFWLYVPNWNKDKTRLRKTEKFSWAFAELFLIVHEFLKL